MSEAVLNGEPFNASSEEQKEMFKKYGLKGININHKECIENVVPKHYLNVSEVQSIFESTFKEKGEEL